MSRTKVLPLIKAGHVKVNWKLIDDPSFLLEEGDHVSVRGYGRFLFAKVEGETKKRVSHHVRKKGIIEIT